MPKLTEPQVRILEAVKADWLVAFVKLVQDAESRCAQCGKLIYVDITEGGNAPDWRDESGDYGCSLSPYTNEDGAGGHEPVRLKRQT